MPVHCVYSLPTSALFALAMQCLTPMRCHGAASTLHETTRLGISRSSPSSRGTLARCMAFTRNFATRFTADDLARLDRVAAHNGLTRASTLRMLIAQAAALLPTLPAAPPVAIPVARPRAKKRRATKRKRTASVS